MTGKGVAAMADGRKPSRFRAFFDGGNAFFRIMGVAFDLIELNLLTLACCVPVVTAGASFTAMHDTLRRMVLHEEGYVHVHFLEAFRRGFRQSTAVWLTCLVVAAVMAVDIAALGSLPASVRGPMIAVLSVVALLVVTVAQWCFVLMSRYENPLRMQVRNAAMVAVGFLPRTLGMLAILVAFGFVYARTFVYAVPLLLLLGLSLPQYCCALLYVPVFARLEGGGRGPAARRTA